MGRRVSAAGPQLTLLVESAMRDEELPVYGLLKVGGAMRVERDVAKDATLKVRVVDAAGEVLCECVAVVESVKLTTKRPTTGAYVERLHAAGVVQ